MGWEQTAKVLPFSKPLPEKDPDRINILILGIRGTGQENTGDLLTDVILLVSIKKSTGQLALISLPRDLYVTISNSGKKEKINSAYAYGGLLLAKKIVSHTVDLFIDYSVSVDFAAFKEIIDALGGIAVYLDKPFEESFQWIKEGFEENDFWFKKEIDGEEKWVFHIPAGRNILNGETALYYVRSRFSTNDFDRMRRQQSVIMAIKDKALTLGVLTNPIKVYNLLDVLGKNIRTDMSLAEIGELINLSSDLDARELKRKIFDTMPEGLLYQTHLNGEYVLLPVGDNFDKIQEEIKNIFQ